MKEKFIYKIADSKEEFEQIHRLNHDTFAGEIPQHRKSSDGQLIDKFHHENTYFICIKNGELAGMMAIRGKRPFSLDAKLENLDSYLPPFTNACEMRLLAVRQGVRGGAILGSLFRLVAKYCQRENYDIVLISGTLRQLKLYRHIGFVPFGPVVGTPEASYQPMYLKPNNYLFGKFIKMRTLRGEQSGKANFLPGPVGIRAEVYQALSEPAISHRSEEFLELHRNIRGRLCRIVSAGNVEIFVGSGTVANDVIAAQLSLISGRGLVLSNGEFGDRLIDHAERFGLDFRVMRENSGNSFDIEEIRKNLDADIRWLWFVHCETSTGVLNDFEAIKVLARERKIFLCSDCISSVGATSVDLRDVYLASCVSGKCLGGVPGLSMVFYNHPLLKSNGKLPRYLDLGLYAEKNGVPFTGSYNMLKALKCALDGLELDRKMRECLENSGRIKKVLKDSGYELAGNESNTIPSVISVNLPKSVLSSFVAEQLAEKGIYISYNSEYLIRSNRIQICLMGDVSPWGLEALLEYFRDLAVILKYT